MTQEGTVDEFWTTGYEPSGDDNVRPLLQALAAARRTRTHQVEVEDPETAAVVDLRPAGPAEVRARRRSCGC